MEGPGLVLLPGMPVHVLFERKSERKLAVPLQDARGTEKESSHAGLKTQGFFTGRWHVTALLPWQLAPPGSDHFSVIHKSAWWYTRL